MRAGFKGIKDIGFEKGGKRVEGKALTTFNGTTYRVYGRAAAQEIAVGEEFDFELKAGGKGDLIDGQTFHKVGEAAPAPPQANYEPPINQQKQTSIETQNAITNACNLWAAGKLEEVETAPVLKESVIAYLSARIISGSHQAQVKASSLVEKAKEAGGVVVDERQGQFKNVGAFLNRALSEFGLERAAAEALIGDHITAKSDLDGMWLMLETRVAEQGGK